MARPSATTSSRAATSPAAQPVDIDREDRTGTAAGVPSKAGNSADVGGSPAMARGLAGVHRLVAVEPDRAQRPGPQDPAEKQDREERGVPRKGAAGGPCREGGTDRAYGAGGAFQHHRDAGGEITRCLMTVPPGAAASRRAQLAAGVDASSGEPAARRSRRPS